MVGNGTVVQPARMLRCSSGILWFCWWWRSRFLQAPDDDDRPAGVFGWRLLMTTRDSSSNLRHFNSLPPRWLSPTRWRQLETNTAR